MFLKYWLKRRGNFSPVFCHTEAFQGKLHPTAAHLQFSKEERGEGIGTPICQLTPSCDRRVRLRENTVIREMWSVMLSEMSPGAAKPFFLQLWVTFSAAREKVTHRYWPVRRDKLCSSIPSLAHQIHFSIPLLRRELDSSGICPTHGGFSFLS